MIASLENPDVSVVILTKNSVPTIERCLKSVIEEGPGEILAIDGMSTDGTLNILRKCGVKILLDSLGSIGYSRRIGVEAANGDFVMFVDSDVRLSRGCITQLKSDLQEFGWDGVHAKVLAWERLSYWQSAVDEDNQDFNRVGSKDYIPMMAALFRRKVLLAHPFDPAYREAAEDLDLGWRLKKDKRQVGVSSAIAYHLDRREFSEFAKQQFSYGLGNARFALKYRGQAGHFWGLADPLKDAFVQAIRLVAKRSRLVPYFLAMDLAAFVGTVAGISKARRSRKANTRRPT